MYKLIKVISILIRNIYLPNPFANIKYGPIINFIIEPFLQIITFGIVGLFYQRGSAPAWGSFLYLFFYATHTCLIILCSIFNFTPIAISIIVILYVSLLTALIKLKNKLSTSCY